MQVTGYLGNGKSESKRMMPKSRYYQKPKPLILLPYKKKRKKGVTRTQGQCGLFW